MRRRSQVARSRSPARDLEEPFLARIRLGVLVLVLGGLDERIGVQVGIDHLEESLFACAQSEGFCFVQRVYS